MQNLKLFTLEDRDVYLKARKGESKFGEHIHLLPKLTNIYDDIVNLDVDYVIFGIQEDIGVYANYGKTGTSAAWQVVLKVLLNIQANRFTKPNKILILGHLDYTEATELLQTSNLSKKKRIQQARKNVEDIDKDLSFLVSSIVKAGKIPIVIGGGHNNSYGNIKGCALAFNSKINIVNFDAHSDFRPEEGRHSGNGFSYAYAEGFLKRYFIFGLHENYTSEVLFKTINKLKDVQYATFEDLEVRRTVGYDDAMTLALNHVSQRKFGIEVDCDAIENMPSSAESPSGFTSKQARQFIDFFGKHDNACYLHICEASPNKKTKIKVGKFISYLITDFIRTHAD